MSRKVLVLGAKGRFGRAAVAAFRADDWQVRAFARSWADGAPWADVETATGDATDPHALTRAAEGCDVIVNALNPPYEAWAKELPRLTAAVIAAAKASGATVMVPGNVYNYGAGMPARLAETTPHAPTARKGRLRETLERSYERAAADGVRTVIVRYGDFIEREQSGNWFDSYIAPKAVAGRVTYPGPRDRVHAWAYLPDAARAMAALAARRHDFAPFEEIGFAGYGLTGDELIAAIERVVGRGMKVGAVPWTMIRLVGLVAPRMREVVEMRYLWQVPHTIDGAKLARLLPDFRATPLDVALADCLGVAPGANTRRAPLTIAHAA